MIFKIRFIQKFIFIGLLIFPGFSVVFGVDQNDNLLLCSQSQAQSRSKDEIQSHYEISQYHNIEPQKPQEQISDYSVVGGLCPEKNSSIARYFKDRKAKNSSIVRYFNDKKIKIKQAKLEADYKKAAENQAKLEADCKKAAEKGEDLDWLLKKST